MGDVDGIGARVRAARLLHGWRIKDLAERSGLSEPYLSQIENGLRMPSMEAASSLAAALGESVLPEQLAQLMDGGHTQVRRFAEGIDLLPALRPLLAGARYDFIRVLASLGDTTLTRMRLRGTAPWLKAPGVATLHVAAGAVAVTCDDERTEHLGFGDLLVVDAEEVLLLQALDDRPVDLLVLLESSSRLQAVDRLAELQVGQLTLQQMQQTAAPGRD